MVKSNKRHKKRSRWIPYSLTNCTRKKKIYEEKQTNFKLHTSLISKPDVKFHTAAAKEKIRKKTKLQFFIRNIYNIHHIPTFTYITNDNVKFKLE